jgi:Na+-transporting NADH:ubiquinone oxidoreductase subunit A
MGNYNLKQGYDIRLVGAPSTTVAEATPVEVAVDGREFPGLRFKMLVKEGDKVKAGTPLFQEKEHADYCFTSPVSGTVKEVRRGDKRVLQEVIISADGKNESVEFPRSGSGDILSLPREKVLAQIGRSGLLATLRQRPYGLAPSYQVVPRDIFVTAINSAPLAPSVELQLKGHEAAFQAGLNALSRVTSGKVHLSIGEAAASDALSKAANVVVHRFSGAHPVGNPGIQIHQIARIRKGDTVWTADVSSVIAIGRLFLEGRVAMQKIISLAGEGLNEALHLRTVPGARLDGLLGSRLKQGEFRIISGDVLSGSKRSAQQFLGFNDQQVTVIPEVTGMEFVGWMKPGFGRESFSRTFFSWLTPSSRYSHHTGYHGGVRALVQTGLYESVLPMDLYPVHLIKGILAQDVEALEGLGILEVIPEDLALCDFVCVSKFEASDVLREGIEFYRKQG